MIGVTRSLECCRVLISYFFIFAFRFFRSAASLLLRGSLKVGDLASAVQIFEHSHISHRIRRCVTAECGTRSPEMLRSV